MVGQMREEWPFTYAGQLREATLVAALEQLGIDGQKARLVGVRLSTQGMLELARDMRKDAIYGVRTEGQKWEGGDPALFYGTHLAPVCIIGDRALSPGGAIFEVELTDQSKTGGADGERDRSDRPQDQPP